MSFRVIGEEIEEVPLRLKEQPADEALADLKQLLDHFDRGKISHDARDRPENAGLRARRDRAFRGRLGKEAAIGGAGVPLPSVSKARKVATWPSKGPTAAKTRAFLAK